MLDAECLKELHFCSDVWIKFAKIDSYLTKQNVLISIIQCHHCYSEVAGASLSKENGKANDLLSSVGLFLDVDELRRLLEAPVGKIKISS